MWVVLSFSFFANAGLILADFQTESNLPGVRTGSPLIYQSLLQTIGAGYELDSSDFLENPDGWGGGVVWIDYDTSSGILRLESQDTWDFFTFDAFIENINFDIVGEYISAITLLDNNLVSDGFIPLLSFTNSSIQISYSGSPAFDFTGGIASFQITTSIDSVIEVPEPSSLAIFAFGIIGLTSRRLIKS
jgi:hypothetical protein